MKLRRPAVSLLALLAATAPGFGASLVVKDANGSLQNENVVVVPGGNIQRLWTPADASGNALGTAGNGIFVNPGTGATFPISGSVTLGGALPAGANAIGSVSVSNFPGTQPVSAAALPLPTGAATAANQTNVQAAAGASAGAALGVQGVAGGVPLNVSGTFSGSVGGFAPGGAYATPLSVSSTSSNVALPAGTTVVVYNVGTNPAYVKLGTSSAVTATTSNDFVPAGGWLALTVGANTYLAAITSGTAAFTTLNISGGAGLLTGSGGQLPFALLPPQGQPAVAVNQLPWQPINNSGQTMSVTTSSSTLTNNYPGYNLAIYNTGAQTAYYCMTLSCTPSTSGDSVPAGGFVTVSTNATNGFFKAITATGTTTLNITAGNGSMGSSAGGGGGGGGGTVTQGTAAAASGAWPVALTQGGSLSSASNGVFVNPATGATFPVSIASSVAVTGTFWQATQPVSAASLPLPSGAATSANQPTNAAIGSTTSGQTGNVHMGAVTTAAPTYTTGQSDPLSLTTAGALRVDASATTQPISASALPLPSGAATAASQTNVQSAPGTSQTTAITIQGNASGVPVPVSGSIAVAAYDSGAISVTASPSSGAHAAGVSVGGLFQIPFLRTNGNSGIISNVRSWTSWGSTASYVLRLWQKNPTSTTCTDGSAFVGSATDDANLISIPQVLQYTAPLNTTGDAKTYAGIPAASIDVKNTDSTATQYVYACLVTNNSDTPGASASILLSLSGPQN